MTNKNCHVTIIVSQSLRQNNIMGKFMPLFSPPFSPLFPPSSFPLSPLPFSPFLWFPPPPSRSSWWRASRPVRGDLSCEREAEGGATRAGAEGRLILVTQATGRHPGTLRDTQKVPKRHLSGWWEGAATCLRKSLPINSGHRDTLQLDMGLQAQKRLRTEVSFVYYISFVTHV